MTHRTSSLAWVLSIVLGTLSNVSFATRAPLRFDAARSHLQEVSHQLRASQSQISHDQAQAQAAKSLHGPKVELKTQQIWGTKTIDMGLDNPFYGKFPPQMPGFGPIEGILTQTPSFNVHFKEDISGPRSALEFQWALFTGGRVQAKIDALHQEVLYSQAQYKGTQLRLDARLAARYWGVQLTRAVENLHRQDLKDRERAVHRAKRQEKVGQLAKIERLQVEVARDQAKRELLDATNQREIAEVELMRLMQMDSLPRLASPLFILTGDLGTLTEWQNKALMQNPMMHGVDAKTRQAQEGVKAAKGAFLPTIFAYGQKNLIKEHLTIPEPDWIAGIGINITLWDQVDRSSSLRAAEALVTKASETKAQVRQQLLTATEVAFLRVTQAQDAYRLTTSTLELAQENLRLREKAFAEGLSTAIEVNEARTKLLGARVAQCAASYQFIVSWALLQATVGEPYGMIDSLSRADFTSLRNPS